jgi:hypothetical protein
MLSGGFGMIAAPSVVGNSAMIRNWHAAGLALLMLLAAGGVLAQEEGDDAPDEEQGFWSQFIDPDDGKLDMSRWLIDNAYGFLPVPIIISEPAVDDGLGLGALFFHQPDPDDPPPEEGKFLLPDVSAVGGAITGNDSWFLGGGHFANWKQDTRRYLGVVGFTDINLDFYGIGGLPLPPGGSIGFNARGFVTLHRFLFRPGESNWFLGADWRYLTQDVSFDLNTGIPPIDDLGREDAVSGVALVARYERLDSKFSPSRGFDAEFVVRANADAIGSDFDFEEYTWKLRQYLAIGEQYSLSWRLDGSKTSGDVPFYLQPFVDLQGIPAMRYQGSAVATAEVRGGYHFTPRWQGLAFVGAGRVGDDFGDLGSATTRTAYGVGFRYLIAKLMGMKVGIDVARGPEETVFYIVTGNAW